jgi:hypothetical protein
MNKKLPGNYLKSITKDRAKDSGMALVLILLIAGFWSGDFLYFKLAAAGLLLDMIFPMVYYPFAVIWFGLSRLLGAIMSKLLLVVIYALIVMPVALFRRLLGKDPFRLKDFKSGSASVFQTRDHLYQVEDLERPF